MSGLVEQVVAERRLPSPELARAIRLAAGVSQARLAAELGVQRVTVARWENGARRPRGDRRAHYGELLRDLQRAVSAP